MEKKALSFDVITDNIIKQLDSSRQNWLFGAGISFESNIPLMIPLTKRIGSIIDESGQTKNIEIYKAISSELDEKCHIEHILSHLGDLIAIATRSKSKSSSIASKAYNQSELANLHGCIIEAIGETVRYGYSHNGTIELIGKQEEPIVEIEHHQNFVKAIFANRSNLLSRSKLTFFSTNYDTLLEDALALEKYTVIDGFSGGAIGYWNPVQEFQNNHSHPNRCLLYKLHGSIDWQRDQNSGLVRTRYGTKYLSKKSDIMIYPQATKYVETQKDPFSFLFSGFRTALTQTDDNVLITCGYSFGDEHINAEIETALALRNNATTLIAFIQEAPDTDTGVIVNERLDKWLADKEFHDRIYVAGKKGVYYKSTIPHQPASGADLMWWTFKGLTNFIKTNDYE